ncbi:MAG: DJ-1/PfpI family protein [Gammaproteobacteria bacterium]|nr:DJ-1/PfpI family protein [Gammaproteobacteria bacterium]
MATVLVPLAQGVEELEAVTVIDLLRRAGIEVVTAGLDAGPVKGSRGTVLLPDTTLDTALEREYDMIVLPGGQPGATHLEQDPRIIALVKKMAGGKKYIAAICAAPKVLARAGVLEGKHVTSYPGALDPSQWPHIQMENRAVVTDGKVITSRGPGTAMDFALELIGSLVGKEKRDQVETALQREK